MKRYLPLLILFIFSSLQVANLAVSLLHHEDPLAEILLENQENEKNCKEDMQPSAFFSWLSPSWSTVDPARCEAQDPFTAVLTSQYYLTKPETPPPNAC